MSVLFLRSSFFPSTPQRVMAPLPGDAPATRRVTAESLRHGLRGGHHDVPIEHPRSEYQLHASGNDKLIPTRQ